MRLTLASSVQSGDPAIEALEDTRTGPAEDVPLNRVKLVHTGNGGPEARMDLSIMTGPETSARYPVRSRIAVMDLEPGDEVQASVMDLTFPIARARPGANRELAFEWVLGPRTSKETRTGLNEACRSVTVRHTGADDPVFIHAALGFRDGM